MDPIPKSGLYYPNKIARITILSLEEVMGKNGLNAILNLANLSHLIDNYPPDNLERQFDFSDFSSVIGALEEMYGPRGGRGLALRCGRVTFADALRHFGSLAGVGDLAFKVLPQQAKLRISMNAMAKIFSQTSDQLSTVEEKEDHLIYTIHRCPVCWGRKTDKPACYIATGLLQEALKWVSGGDEFRVTQTTAHSTGDPTCDFVIQKEPIG
ncbi:MAG: 4-vinyl reductase [Chloroflexi bacterium]|nr:4-vinyl reductase [Anaerolineaceae bacterium]NMB91030.1 4-vinyl reductase [Chloroflexota bacterium]